MYQAMRQRLGHQQWWPGDGPLEVCIGAILTQNTSWSNVESAIANLKAADCMTVGRLDAIPREALAELIRPVGYFKLKAKRLKNFIALVGEGFGDDIEAFLDRSGEVLRQQLLGVNGIGPETADSIILYAAELPSFVVDTYTHRILLRHGLISPQDDYQAVKDLFEWTLPQDVDLWGDFHAQLVAVGKNFCRRRRPLCEGCPLEQFPHDITDPTD